MTSRPGIASALHCRSVVIAGKPAVIAGSKPSFAAVWSNPEDDAYDAL